MMFTGKDTASEQKIEPRVCVAPRYENAFTRFAEFVVPKYRNSVRGVFAADAKDVRKHFGSDALKDGSDKFPRWLVLRKVSV